MEFGERVAEDKDEEKGWKVWIFWKVRGCFEMLEMSKNVWIFNNIGDVLTF